MIVESKTFYDDIRPLVHTVCFIEKYAEGLIRKCIIKESVSSFV